MTENQLFTHGVGTLGNLIGLALGRFAWTLTYFVPATSVGILSAGLGILHSHPPQSNPRTLRLTLIGILAAALIVSLWPLPRHGWWI